MKNRSNSSDHDGLQLERSKRTVSDPHGSPNGRTSSRVVASGMPMAAEISLEREYEVMMICYFHKLQNSRFFLLMATEMAAGTSVNVDY